MNIDTDKPNDKSQSFVLQSVSKTIGFVIALFLVGAFVGWYFYLPSEEEVRERQAYIESEQRDPSLPTPDEQMPGNRYEEDSGRSDVYNFFYKVFGGIEDGLEDNSHNLNNVERLGDLNLDGGHVDHSVSEVLTIKKMAELKAAQLEALNQDNYRHSVFDVVGSEVYGRKGGKVGEVYDILVNKDTGKAKVIVMNDDESRYERDLTALRFKNILKQHKDGGVMMTISEETIEDTPDFLYSSIGDTNYISLRALRDGQLLDFEGKVTGQIDAVIYENAEAHNIYFTLRPNLAQRVVTKFFLPFDEAQIIESIDGYDIKLTEEQTVELAEQLFKAKDK